jgi:lysylphosphatidylglycerol synthetase-like protein (DUF2156 family)
VAVAIHNKSQRGASPNSVVETRCAVAVRSCERSLQHVTVFSSNGIRACFFCGSVLANLFRLYWLRNARSIQSNVCVTCETHFKFGLSKTIGSCVYCPRGLDATREPVRTHTRAIVVAVSAVLIVVLSLVIDLAVLLAVALVTSLVVLVASVAVIVEVDALDEDNEIIGPTVDAGASLGVDDPRRLAASGSLDKAHTTSRCTESGALQCRWGDWVGGPSGNGTGTTAVTSEEVAPTAAATRRIGFDSVVLLTVMIVVVSATDVDTFCFAFSSRSTSIRATIFVFVVSLRA